MTLQELEISGRVLNVRPRGMDRFAVVVNAHPHLYWFSTDTPPRLGELVRLTGDQLRVDDAVTILNNADFTVVPEAYIRREVPKDLVDRVAFCSRRKLYRYQVDGAAWVASRLADGHGAILADDPGCVDGEAVLRVCRAGGSKELRLHELYSKFNYTWSSCTDTYVRALCNGEFRLHRISAVVDKGKRRVVRLTLKSGKSLCVTPDHEICVGLRGGGFGWLAAGKLGVGAEVVTDGTAVCKRCRGSDNVVTNKYSTYVGYCRTCIYRYLRSKPTWKGGKYRDKDGYVLVSGKHNHPRASRGSVYEHILVMEAAIGRFVSTGEIVHHRHLHGGISAKGGEVVFVPSYDKVVAVEPAGKKPVYDIVCDDPHRNFVANGVVVHNCGKSAQAICAVLAIQAMPCLIVCPKTLRDNWLHELQIVPRWQLVSEFVERGKDIPRAHFVICNYDVLARHERGLAMYGFRSLIYDEAHAVKNPRGHGSHRAAVATRIAAAIRRVVLLTGSPVPNGPEELWRLLHMTEPEAWPSFVDFRRRYCISHDGEKGAVRTSTGTLSRVQEFHALVAPAFLRRLKAHILELPPKRRRVVRVVMHPDDQAAYASAEADVRAWLHSLGAEAGTAKRERETLLRLAVLRRIAALAKLRSAFPAYIESWRKIVGRPLVVFGYHKSVVAGAARRAVEVGAKVAVLSAATKYDQRQAIVDAFNRGAVDMLVCSLKIAGVGLNLQHASDVIFLERLWTPAMMDQAEDRLHRIGQEREVVCSYFDAVDTIDEHIAYVLRSKRRIISHVVGDIHAEQQAAQALIAQRLTAST